mmetsp:Transcript_8443/g.12677  ORF Transcript_8443/g.12677 Transcript_8443/m.12677 type:complete len:260 (+) Transcript_8443:113-892(+)
MSDGRNVNNENSSWRSNVAFGIIGTSFVGTIFLISPFVTMQLRSPLPYMATPRAKVLAALKYIAARKTNSNYFIVSGPRSGSALPSEVKFNGDNSSILKKGYSLRYYDLGSGDGETVFAASSQGWKATGIEMNHTLWAVSSFRRLLSSPEIRRRSRFILGDMWAQNIQDADAVMIFGVKPLMPKIAEKLRNECRPGTFIMSYRFLIPYSGGEDDNDCNGISSNGSDKKERAHDDVPTSSSLNAKLVYDKDEMRIYELKD